MKSITYDLDDCTHLSVDDTMPFIHSGYVGTITITDIWYNRTGTRVVIQVTEIETPMLHIYQNVCSLGYCNCHRELSLIFSDTSALKLSDNKELVKYLHTKICVSAALQLLHESFK